MESVIMRCQKIGQLYVKALCNSWVWLPDLNVSIKIYLLERVGALNCSVITYVITLAMYCLIIV